MTAFISYNIFGRQNWGTDFGEMSMNSYLQINFRNGGRTGVGFQLGLNFLFDWFNPNKKTKSAAPTVQPKPQKTVIKSLSMK